MALKLRVQQTHLKQARLLLGHLHEAAHTTNNVGGAYILVRTIGNPLSLRWRKRYESVNVQIVENRTWGAYFRGTGY